MNAVFKDFEKILRDRSSWKDFLIKSSLSWGVWIRMILRKVMFRQITKIAIFKSVPSYPSLLQKEKIKQKFMNLFHSNKHNLWLIFLFDLLQKFKYKLDFMFQKSVFSGLRCHIVLSSASVASSQTSWDPEDHHQNYSKSCAIV